MLTEEDGVRTSETVAARQFASWLVRSTAKTEIFVPPGLGFAVTMNQFADTVGSLCAANQLPAMIWHGEVQWDDTRVTQTRVLVEHLDRSFSPLKILLGLDQVGSFYYVEEKVCWDLPQDLPAPPQRRVASRPVEPETFPMVLLMGPIWLKRQREQYRKDLLDWETSHAYDEAIATWAKRIIELDQRSRTDDVLGRFHLAVRGTTRQAIQLLFLDRKAELCDRQEKEVSRQELEAELERRKHEGFR